jgi:hypothetical protein
MDAERNQFKELPWRLFAVMVVLWLCVGLAPWLLLHDLQSAADFAGTFSFVEALFTALAFGGVIWAIRLQTKELEMQRLEVEETREELRRAADAQHQSQQMQFLTALLMARNSVAQGYATAAQHESGPLRSSQIAHRQHLAELEWLLQMVDRHAGNPFALPPAPTLVAQQAALLLKRSYPVLQAALTNRASNHIRGIMVDLNQSLRELRRMLTDDEARQCELFSVLDKSIADSEGVTTASDYDEIAAICSRVFNNLSSQLSSSLDVSMPMLDCAARCDAPGVPFEGSRPSPSRAART